MAVKHRPILIAVAVLVMASLACSLLSNASNSGSSTSGSDETATVAPAGDSGSSDSDSSSGSDSSSEPTGDESGGFSSLDEGLASLDSYRMTFSMNVDGKDESGNPKSGTFEILQEINRKTNEQHMRISGTQVFSDTSSGDSGSAFEVYQIQDATYMVSAGSDGTPGCTMFSSSDSASSNYEIYKPSDLLGSMDDAKLVKKGVTVNGVKTDQYKVSNTGLGFGAFSKGDASFWLAQEAKYVVKYTGEATGKAAGLFNVDGTVKWDYAIDQANELPAVALPAECEAQKPSTDIPIPDNATDKSILGKMITFNTPDSVSAVADFYKKAMPENGWTAGDVNDMGETMVTLAFTQDSRKANVTITQGDSGGALVMLQEE
jgi:hypothetical protein